MTNCNFDIIQELLLSQGFFRRWPLNSRTKKLKLKEKISKNSQVFSWKTQETGKFGANFAEKLKILPENRHFDKKNGKISENSRIFAKLKPEICQKLKKPEIPQILSIHAQRAV